MHFAHLAFAGALAFATCGVGASGTRDVLPAPLIGSCLTDLDELAAANNHPDSHRFDLHKYCPELAKQLALPLEAGTFGPLSTDAASVEALRDLQFFATGFGRQPVPPEKYRFDYHGLDALLAEVLIEETVDDSLWEQFLRWLEQFAKDGESPGLDRFLDWLESLEAPPWFADAILKTSVVLIVLLALMVIGNELRLSGLLRRVRRPSRMTTAAGGMDAPPRARGASLDEIRSLPPRQFAAAVLQIVTATFADRGWLSASSSLTNGELVRQLGQRSRGIAGTFSDLVHGIETVIYGDRLPDDESRQRLTENARELVDLARGGPPVTPQGPR